MLFTISDYARYLGDGREATTSIYKASIASQAMAAMLSNPGYDDVSYKRIAKDAVDAAEELLEALLPQRTPQTTSAPGEKK